MSRTNIDSKLKADLISIYEEVMWLANRQNVSPSGARAWYTHVMSGSVIKRVRRFSGRVSHAAIANSNATLRLEHFKRIQTTLTALVRRHKASGVHNPNEFVKTIIDYEQVHIVTFEENYAALRAKGDYKKAGIVLVPWDKIPKRRRQELWLKMLRGKVANAAEFKSKIG